MMKAIETQYKGYRFRSRLEARWAVFFDALGLAWQYEPEGFELPAGRYLPDFFVAGFLWVEVKGKEPTERELLLIEELADGKDQLAFIGAGLPDVEGWIARPRQGIDRARIENFFGAAVFKRFESALDAAKGARFEFGENVAPTMARPDEFEALARK